MTQTEIAACVRRMPARIKAALFDMDGVLYDSMPRHAKAWMAMCREEGFDAREEEFFLLEGKRGTDIADFLMQRQYGRGVTPDEAERLYGVKCRYFMAGGPAAMMPGAAEAVRAAMAFGARPVLVTGSGQASILTRLGTDYPDAFADGMRVTAKDVMHGKPHPEPFLAGLAKAGVRPDEAIAIDNAPLGVKSALSAGVFTIGVRTGPIPAGELLRSGADVELNGMFELAELLTARRMHG